MSQPNNFNAFLFYLIAESYQIILQINKCEYYAISLMQSDNFDKNDKKPHDKFTCLSILYIFCEINSVNKKKDKNEHMETDKQVRFTGTQQKSQNIDIQKIKLQYCDYIFLLFFFTNTENSLYRM